LAGDDPETDRDRIRAAAALDYEIDYLVVKSGVTREQARELIIRHGNDRETLIKHARSSSDSAGQRAVAGK
jgi:ribonucleotide monophosphatase NagD (HAD superfamily)